MHNDVTALCICAARVLLFYVMHYSMSWRVYLSISVDCGPPFPPQNGSLEDYTNTTEDSEVFYRCDPDLVPEGRMRAVCAKNGWNPNPASLTCNVGMYVGSS